MSKEITRRRFLVLGSGAGLSAFLGGAYVVSACPLTDTGICVGPCAAYIDRRGDGLCDRAYAERAAQAVAQEKDGARQASESGAEPSQGSVSSQTTSVSCPFGLVNDPYPGQCRHYVDRDGDGICDLSVPEETSQTSQLDSDGDAGQALATPTPAPTVSQPQAGVACPFGLVNDPYPGQCRHYVDRDGDGICDLSVPQDGGQASQPDDEDAGQASAAPTPVPSTPQPQVGVACPFGVVNDPYPGRCRRYVDQDGDGICDLSEPGSGLNAPEGTAGTEEEGSRRRRGWGSGRR